MILTEPQYYDEVIERASEIMPEWYYNDHSSRIDSIIWDCFEKGWSPESTAQLITDAFIDKKF